VCHIR